MKDKDKVKVSITFRHSRDIFTGNRIKTSLKKMFPTVRFCGCEYGNHYPKISVDKVDWEAHSYLIKNKKNYIKHEF